MLFVYKYREITSTVYWEIIIIASFSFLIFKLMSFLLASSREEVFFAKHLTWCPIGQRMVADADTP